MRLPIVLALAGLVSIVPFAKADTVDFTLVGSSGAFSGNGTFVVSNNGNGSYTITNILNGVSSTQDNINSNGVDTGPAVGTITALLAPKSIYGNDNLLFPYSTPVLDNNGFSFTDSMGNTDYTVNVFANSDGSYAAFLTDNDGGKASVPVTVSLSTLKIASAPSAMAPEPSSIALLGTALLGAAGLLRKRFV